MCLNNSFFSFTEIVLFLFCAVFLFLFLHIKLSVLFFLFSSIRSAIKIKHITCRYWSDLVLCYNYRMINKVFIGLKDVQRNLVRNYRWYIYAFSFNVFVEWMEEDSISYKNDRDTSRTNKDVNTVYFILEKNSLAISFQIVKNRFIEEILIATDSSCLSY